MAEQTSTEQTELDAPNSEGQTEESQTVEQTVEQTKNRHGHLSFDEYTEQGGDPEMYRGQKAFDQFNGIKQQMKSMKNSNSEMLGRVNDMMAQQKTVIMEQNQTKILELEAQLKNAHIEADSKTAVRLQQSIDHLEATNKQQVAQPSKNNDDVPVEHEEEFLDFQEEYPDINPKGDAFNLQLSKDLVARVESEYTIKMSSRELRRLLKRSYKSITKEVPVEKRPRQAISTNSPTKKPMAKPNAAAKLAKLDGTGRAIYNHFVDNKNEAAASEFLDKFVVS